MSVGARIKAPFETAARFLTDVWFELKRVVWPSREEAQSFTVVVLVAVAAVAIWVGSLDWICSQLITQLQVYGK